MGDMKIVEQALGAIIVLLFATLLFLSTSYVSTSLHTRKVLELTKEFRINSTIVKRKQQVMLWTLMRSGSRFTQTLLKALPCSFGTEEPLRTQGRKGTEFSIQLMRDILQCRLVQRPDYFKQWMYGSQRNEYKIKLYMCDVFPRICDDFNFAEALCLSACIRLLRVVAVDLGLAETLLQDPTSNVKVVHLVRDPRAVLASREELQEGFKKQTGMVAFFSDEINSTTICDRYTRDLASARVLAQRYPNRYTLVRYEDLAQHPPQEVRRLYNFLELPYTAQVANKVITHTLDDFHVNAQNLDPYSTFKNSTATVFAWRDHLDFSEVTRLQQECGAVLEGYGYRTYPTPRHYHDPHNTPLLPLPRPS